MSDYQSDACIAGNYGDKNSPKGVVLAAFGSFTVPTGDVAAAKTIDMVPVPKNARILGVGFTADAGSDTGATVALGDGTTADEFQAAQDTSTSVNNEANASIGYKFSAAGNIVATTAGAALTAGRVLTAMALYIID